MKLKGLCQRWQEAHERNNSIQWYEIRVILTKAAGQCPITGRNEDWLLLAKIAKYHQYS